MTQLTRDGPRGTQTTTPLSLPYAQPFLVGTLAIHGRKAETLPCVQV
jgi:hypothetical protein